MPRRDEIEYIGEAPLAEDKVILPQKVIDTMRLHPDDYVEIFNYSGIGQMEFSGISYVDDDYGIYVPEEVMEKLGKRDQVHFSMAKDIAIIRIEEKEQQKDQSTRSRFSSAGTLTQKTPAVEMRVYKHVCDVIRYGNKDYVPMSNVCALCGGALKGKGELPEGADRTPKCVRCGKPVPGNFCANCGLKLRRRESARKCTNCGGDLKFIEDYGRFYCFKCKQYEKAVKPGQKVATCPACGKGLSYVKQHDKFYCFSCKAYKTPKESGIAQPAPAKPAAPAQKSCPDCRTSLTFVDKYKRYYCKKCQGYKRV